MLCPRGRLIIALPWLVAVMRILWTRRYSYWQIIRRIMRYASRAIRFCLQRLIQTRRTPTLLQNRIIWKISITIGIIHWSVGSSTKTALQGTLQILNHHSNRARIKQLITSLWNVVFANWSSKIEILEINMKDLGITKMDILDRV